MPKSTSKHHQGLFPSIAHRVGFLLKETLPLGSAPGQLGQEAPVIREASGFLCREELKPLQVGEGSWGEVSRQGPHCQHLQAASSPSARDNHHYPSSSSSCTPGPCARRGSAKLTHKAGHSSLGDPCFLSSNVLNLERKNTDR